MSAPLPFFPDASFAYCKEAMAGKKTKEALFAAMLRKWPEEAGADPWNDLAFGESDGVALAHIERQAGLDALGIDAVYFGPPHVARTVTDGQSHAVARLLDMGLIDPAGDRDARRHLVHDHGIHDEGRLAGTGRGHVAVADRDPFTGIPHHRYVRCRVERV